MHRFSLLLLAVLLGACGEPPPEPPATPTAQRNPVTPAPTPPLAPAPAVGLSDAELSLELPPPEPTPEAVDFADATAPLRLEIFAEGGYENADGLLVLDVLERDYLYLTLLIEDADGRVVRGAAPRIKARGDSQVKKPAGSSGLSNAEGALPFGVVGGSMGEDRIDISVGAAQTSALINVISLKAAGYPSLADIEGVLDWNLLRSADIRWGEKLSASFPAAIRAEHGQTVRLAGFMMPLETSAEQKHFVLASNPPSCFFHIPGGPAGAVEVFASEPIAVGWDLIVLEGRFETVSSSDIDVVYRLHEARQVPL